MSIKEKREWVFSLYVEQPKVEEARIIAEKLKDINYSTEDKCNGFSTNNKEKFIKFIKALMYADIITTVYPAVDVTEVELPDELKNEN